MSSGFDPIYYSGTFLPIVVLKKSSSKSTDSYALKFYNTQTSTGKHTTNISNKYQGAVYDSYDGFLKCAIVLGDFQGNPLYNKYQYGTSYEKEFNVDNRNSWHAPLDWDQKLNGSENVTNSVVLSKYGITFNNNDYLQPTLSFSNISVSTIPKSNIYYCKTKYQNTPGFVGTDPPYEYMLPSLCYYGNGHNGQPSCNNSTLHCQFIANGQCTLQCDTNCYVGTLDLYNSTIINGPNMIGTCIIDNNIINTDYSIYNFDNLVLQPQNIGTQKNNWTDPSQSGWTLLVKNDDIDTIDTTLNAKLPTEAHGAINIRYVYNYNIGDTKVDDLQVYPFFKKSDTQITNLINCLQLMARDSSIGTSDNGQTTLKFTDFAGCSAYMTRTVLYIFLSYFYGQLYQYGEFSDLTMNNFYSKSGSNYNIMNGISQFIKDKITTPYTTISLVTYPNDSTKPIVSIPPSIFSSLFVPPTVCLVDTTDNQVYLRCYLPIRMVTGFFNQSKPNQSATILAYLSSFFNETNDQYYSGNKAKTTKTVRPAKFEMVFSENNANHQNDLLSIITYILTSNVNNTGLLNLGYHVYQIIWMDIKTNTLYKDDGQHAYNVTDPSQDTQPSIISWAGTYTTPNYSINPFVLAVGVTVKVNQWSPKVAAYCLQQIHSNLINKTPLPYTPDLSLFNTALAPSPNMDKDNYQIQIDKQLYSIYLNMTRSGWIPTQLYKMLTNPTTYNITPLDAYTIRAILEDFCNVYQTPMRNSQTGIYEDYNYLYPWLMSRYSSGTTQNDCMCVFSGLSPVGIPSPNQTAMSFDTHCNGVSPSVLEVFGVTSESRSSENTCNLMNEWLTTSNIVNQSTNKGSFDTDMYSSSCGSVYSQHKIRSFNSNIITMGIVLLILLTFLVGVACYALRIRPIYTSGVCIVTLGVIGVVIYYAAGILVGNWSCPKNDTGSQPICKSAFYSTMQLPEEFCTDTKPLCECKANTDCSFLGVVSPVTELLKDANGNCVKGQKDATGNCFTANVKANGVCVSGQDASGNCLVGTCIAGTCQLNSHNPRPTQTVQVDKVISYTWFVFLLALAVLIPLTIVSLCYVIPYKLPSRVVSILILVCFCIPIFYLYAMYSKPQLVTMYTDNPKLGGR